ncbi:MAG TPA: ABC transporter permease subunit [Nocardioidaceae bacterium]|nr:ABC transporter permease subunit [Nocardioidaceae bacterium]
MGGRRSVAPPVFEQARARWALLAVVVVAVLALVVVPLAAMVRTVTVDAGGRVGAVLTAPGFGSAIGTSLIVAAAVTALAVPVGAAFAVALRGSHVPTRTALRVAVLLPVLVPDFVLGFSWLAAFGRSGFVDDLIGWSWPGVQSLAGVTVVLAVNAAPVAYLLTVSGLSARAESDLEWAARAAGARPWTVLRTITMPLLAPSLAMAATVVFVLALGAFAIPEILGSATGVHTVTTRIYADLASSSDPASFVAAVTLALVLVLIAAAVVGPADALLTPGLRTTRTSGGSLGAAPGGRVAGRLAATMMWCYLAVAVGIPLLALLATAVTRAVGVLPVPSNWTLANFTAVLTARNGEALGRSMVLALVAASVLAVLGGVVALLERDRAGRAAGTLVALTFVLPGSTLAVGLLIGYGRWIGGSLLIIGLAYLAKLWALAHRPVSGALDRLPPEETHASRVSGATSWVALRTVLLRPLAPALLAGWLVCFLTGLHEVTMSSLLYGPGNETLAVVVLNSEELGQVGLTAALSVLLTLLVLVLAAVLWWLVSRVRRSVGVPDVR